MTHDRLEEYRNAAKSAKERADKATPGPWRHDNSRTHHYIRGTSGEYVLESRLYGVHTTPDAQFIAAARTDIPTLADAVAELVAEVEKRDAEYARGRADAVESIVKLIQATGGRLDRLAFSLEATDD